MSKVFRIVLASIVSLGVIVGIYSRVEGATISARQERAGAHQVSGVQVNLDHYRQISPASPSLAPSNFPSGKGHGCESESHISPED